MRYLLDTHTAFWFFEDNPRLSARVKTIITNDRNAHLFISMVSAWEIAIKRSLDREDTRLCSVEEFLDGVDTYGFELIGISPDAVKRVESLPFHHRDPFDRLLIATAIADNMTFLSADENVRKYDVKWEW
ncbi:MAG: type II toxin-antitoxin system VapC family toxin [Lachnospiraceae bacterium]|jgi:PIN domain nuclease of toxin-antitoxin system|nr:type II toxin-antitoxin system VapC family toxin [Lachnospiraceae bacterium]